MSRETAATPFRPTEYALPLVPAHFFAVSAGSEGFTPLNAFDNALLEAGIGDTNLVRVSSIIPPGCTKCAPLSLPPGALVPTAYAYYESDRAGEVISAAVAICLPEEEHLPGLIMEHSGAEPLESVSTRVEEMAARGFARRGRTVGEISVVGAEHRVDSAGAVIAGVVLWH